MRVLAAPALLVAMPVALLGCSGSVQAQRLQAGLFVRGAVVGRVAATVGTLPRETTFGAADCVTYRVAEGAPAGTPFVVRLSLAGGITNNAPTDRYFRTDVLMIEQGHDLRAGQADSDDGTYEPLAYARRPSPIARNGGGNESGEEALIPTHPSARLLSLSETATDTTTADTFPAYDETFVAAPVTGCSLAVTEVHPPTIEEPLTLGP